MARRILVEFTIEDESFEDIRKDCAAQEDIFLENVTDIKAFQFELQHYLYDEGGSSGSFNIINITKE